ncbi:MAG: hypothetical protein GXP47_03855, partial [Acidobacteria bacterium]|nr:hypothetical protein [Acidobacteriota bacterium]
MTMVKQLRVVDLAKTMGITPAELIFKLKSIGVNVNTEEDALDFSTVRAIITGETLQKRPREVIVRSESAEGQEDAPASARDRLVRRKRRRIIKTEREIAEVAAPAKKAAEAEEAAPATAETPVETAEVKAGAPQAQAEAAGEILETGAVEVEAQPAGVETPEETVAEAESTETTGTAAVEAAPAEAEEEEVKPAPEVSEEELTAGRKEITEEPKRIRARKAKTPLERGLRELSPDEIKQRLQAQRDLERRRKEAGSRRAVTSSKDKAAADANEIRELLKKFEEQKVQTGQEGAATPGRPTAPRRPMPGRGR